MSKIKVVTFNAEWMISIFNGDWYEWDGTIHQSFAGKYLGPMRLEPIDDIPELCRRIAGTIKDTGGQIIGIQEGPPRQDQMEMFVKDHLGDAYAVFTSNSRHQTIHALVHKNITGEVTQRDPYSDDVKKMWHDIPFQPWGSIAREQRKLQDFYRRPLMLEYKSEEGKIMEILVLHSKSKTSDLKNAEQWEERDEEAVTDAILSRQKLSAEMQRLREYAEKRLDEMGDHHPMVIMGDLNDGPYAEDLEKEFLIHNIIDELVGTVLRPDVLLRHAMSPTLLATASSTEFNNPLKNNQLTRVLLDHILVSPGIWKAGGAFNLVPDSCKVEDAAYDKYFDSTQGHEERHLRPGDHRPVSVELSY
jgi:hypothetical protein